MIPPKVQRFLVVGLGNPGVEYAVNRHNVGWLFLDDLADALLKKKKDPEPVAFTPLAGMAAECAEGTWSGRQFHLLKPLTYMNLSGSAVSKAVVRFSIPSEGIVVVYDDVDLPFGHFRIRPRGSAGGHRGVESLIERLGTTEFVRLRIGVGPPLGSTRRRGDLADYVLSDFDEAECRALGPIFDECRAAFRMIVRSGVQQAMNRYNRKVEAEAKGEGDEEDGTFELSESR